MDSLWEFLDNLLFGWRLPYLPNIPHLRRRTARRSIIRMIGSLLPFPKVQRVHLNLAVWRDDNQIPFEGQVFPVDDLHRSSPESIDEGFDSASCVLRNYGHLQENACMKKLLDEILELKKQMNEILEQQKTTSRCSCVSARQSSCADTHERLQGSTGSAPSLPPPPPPPPPPLPSTPLFSPRVVPPPLSSSTPSKRQAKNREETPGFHDVLKELKEKTTTGLKPLPRTPGGRPQKYRSSDTDTPGSGKEDTLADILRKRYVKSEPKDSDRP